MWALFNWFDNIGVTDTLVVITYASFIVTAVILIVKPKLRIGNWSFSFGSGVGSQKVDYFHIVSKTSEITTKMCQLDLIRMVKMQLNYVDQRMVLLKSSVMNVYAKKLCSKTDCANVTAHEDYILFSKLVETMLREEVVPQLRLSFMSNGFDKMGSIEYQNFVKSKFEYVYQLCNSFMDMWYISNKMIVPRDGIKKVMDEIKGFMRDMFFDMYTNASVVKRNIDKERRVLQKELDDYLERVTGEKRI